ncbi:hypothetical protein P3T76_015129 [Phytophthora citrophthora]|nr:hypothetical protein P3T76_015129 [Phytophthora citrophthora]
MNFTTNEQAELDAICELGQRLTREDLVKGALLVKIPQKILRVNLSGGLYVRQEYWDVHAIMNEGLNPEDRVLVIGSPGIGKSVFGVFLLLLFMSERKNVAYRPLGNDARILFFTWNGIEKRYDGTLWPVSGHQYEGLFDGKEFGTPWAVTAIFVHSYLFASPRTKNYNEFVKERCTRVYMNPWTKDECQEYADAVGLMEDEWFIRHSLVGGKSRQLFSSKLTIDGLKNEVSKAIPDDFTKLETVVKGVENGKFSDMMKNTLFEMYRDVEEPGQCFMRFASAFIESMVSATYHGEKNDNIKNLLKTSDPNLQAWRGRVCERFLLRDAAIREIRVRPLDDETRRQTIRSLGPYNATSTSVQAASDIHAEKMVYLPESKNFPAIDGVLIVPAERRLIYLQATIARRHPIKHQRFKDIIEILKDCGEFADYRHILLFLVEGDTYDQFRHQNYENMNEEDRQKPDSLGVKVTQYVGKII